MDRRGRRFLSLRRWVALVALQLFFVPTLALGSESDDASASVGSRETTIQLAEDLLLVPIRNGAPKAEVSLFVGEKRVRRFVAALAHTVDDVSFWAYVDARPFRGELLRVVVEGPAPSRVVLIRQGDTYPGQEALYRETHRPRFHFTSRRGWNNDPNGLVHYRGEWHLFYQHNPVGWAWDNMHWGHAVSDDLVHWRELGDTLFPWTDHAKGHVYSGSGFVDWHNTSGFQDGDHPPLVVAFTDTEAGESLAYSNDRGRTFTAYPGNPVVEHKGRDPKILWHEPTGRWVMAVYDETEERSIDFYSSADLREWRFESRLPGFYECPELLELPIDGGPETRWIVFAADGQYVLGSFDGRVFSPEHDGKHSLWYGNFYASQVYSDAPDERWIQVGWARGNEYPGMPFNQGMTVPVELSLRDTPDGPRLFAEPVPELRTLRREHTSRPAVNLAGRGQRPLGPRDRRLRDRHAPAARGRGRRHLDNRRGQASSRRGAGGRCAAASSRLPSSWTGRGGFAFRSWSTGARSRSLGPRAESPSQKEYCFPSDASLSRSRRADRPGCSPSTSGSWRASGPRERLVPSVGLGLALLL